MPDQSNLSDWPWPESLDAVKAAPDSHDVLMENDHVRIVEVVIPPAEKEPIHAHRWPSVMLVDQAAQIRYYNEDSDVVSETPERTDNETTENTPPQVEWLEPESPHAVENIDTVPYHAIRVELKQK